MPVTGQSPDRGVPAPLTVAASLAGVEAVALTVLALLETASLSTERLTLGVTTTLFFLAAAAGLGFCAWSLWRVRRWARGPVVMAQLICLGLAYNLWQADRAAVAVALALVGLVVVAGLLHPASTDVLEADARRGGDPGA